MRLGFIAGGTLPSIKYQKLMLNVFFFWERNRFFIFLYNIVQANTIQAIYDILVI